MTELKIHSCDRCGCKIETPHETVYTITFGEDVGDYCYLCYAYLKYHDNGKWRVMYDVVKTGRIEEGSRTMTDAILAHEARHAKEAQVSKALWLKDKTK